MALPDWPSLKVDLNRIFSRAAQAAIDQETVAFQSIGSHIQHEGDSGRTATVDGEVSDMVYERVEGQEVLKKRDIPKLTFNDAIEAAQSMGRQVGRQKAQYIIKTIDQATKKSGNVVNAKGQKLSAKLLLDVLENIEVPFDDEGNQQQLTMLVHPSQKDAIQKIMSGEDKSSPEAKRYEEIIERKRKEWRAKESRRKLVD